MADLPAANGPLAGDVRPDRWTIGILRGPSPLDLRGDATHPVVTPEMVSDFDAEFVADPFLVRDADRWFLFFEAMPRGSHVGVIGLAESPDGTRWRYRSTVLREPFHLSYPHVFAWQGDYYMTPETLGHGRVRLYRASRFPEAWEPVADLIPGQHADPTIFRWDGRWWMFTCCPPYQHATLRLFFADALTGPWSEHPQSPIVRDDPSSARPAGRVVAWDGGLIRFAQDCVPWYGFAVRAFRITLLSRDEYREEPATPGRLLGPGSEPWSPISMHHVDAHPLPGGDWLAAADGR